MSDLVNRVSGLPTLDSSNPRGVYKTIMDPDLTLPYVAATLKKSIDAYSSIAGFDISQQSRPDGDALQCRQSGGARPRAEGRE